MREVVGRTQPTGEATALPAAVRGVVDRGRASWRLAAARAGGAHRGGVGCAGKPLVGSRRETSCHDSCRDGPSALHQNLGETDNATTDTHRPHLLFCMNHVHEQRHASAHERQESEDRRGRNQRQPACQPARRSRREPASDNIIILQSSQPRQNGEHSPGCCT